VTAPLKPAARVIVACTLPVEPCSSTSLSPDSESVNCALGGGFSTGGGFSLAGGVDSLPPDPPQADKPSAKVATSAIDRKVNFI
jgi:hypothetical protein